jgi:hypothetical protein
MLPDGLNAAQIAAVQQYVTVMQKHLAGQIALRQWCVEKAIETDVSDRIKMAREMFNFITEVEA